MAGGIHRASGVFGRMGHKKFNHGAVGGSTVNGKSAVRIHNHRIDFGVIQKTVGAGIEIIDVVESNTIFVQVDPQSAIAVDEIIGERIPAGSFMNLDTVIGETPNCQSLDVITVVSKKNPLPVLSAEPSSITECAPPGAEEPRIVTCQS